jgi:hypothetical protein
MTLRSANQQALDRPEEAEKYENALIRSYLA